MDAVVKIETIELYFLVNFSDTGGKCATMDVYYNIDAF